MAIITHSFMEGGQFDTQDWTKGVLNVPNKYGFFNDIGLFLPEPVTNENIGFEDLTLTNADLIDRARGERQTVGRTEIRSMHNTRTIHFPIDDAISVNDLKGKRAVAVNGEDPNGPETVQAVINRKLARIRSSAGALLEFARARAIVTGEVYAPSGNYVQNWYTEFGVSQKSVAFALNTGTTEVLDKINEVVAHIQDNIANGQVMTGISFACSPEFFQKLITHASVKDAYKFYESTQEPLRRGGRENGAQLRRDFFHGGVMFYEVREKNASGVAHIPAGEAYAFPTGTDAFLTMFSPAYRFDTYDQVGRELYLFQKLNDDNNQIILRAETNFVNVVKRPQAVVKCTL